MTIEIQEEQIIELVMSSWRLLRKIENNHSNIMNNIDGRGDQDMIPYKEITNEFDELFNLTNTFFHKGEKNKLQLVEDDEEIKTSECCGEEMHEDYDLCPKCLEHT